MSTFYLQKGVPDNGEGYQETRMFLDAWLHAGCACLNTYSAETWIDARLMVPA